MPKIISKFAMTEIAVLIAAHNAEKHLPATVQSVFESSVPVHLFIVDDASRIPVADILPPQENLTIIRSAENIGLARALNLGLTEILKQDFKFIARLDAEDLCRNDRFARQYSYLNAHPDVGLVGSWLRFIDEDDESVLRHYQPPEHHTDLIKAMPFNSPILHPTWLMRAAVAQKIYPYSTEFKAAEDYEFLQRTARQFRLANVPEYLVDARDTKGGISRRRRMRQLCDRLGIQFRFFNFLNWRCYGGILKTLILLLLPAEFIRGVKNLIRS